MAFGLSSIGPSKGTSERIAIGGLGGLIALLAWVSLVRHSPDDSGLVSAFLAWNVMMVAMMLPSLFPWLFLFSLPRALVFTAGYFTVWAAYCAAAAGIQTLFQVAHHGVPGIAGGALLAGAGLYQVSPLKTACLRQCRSPVASLLKRFRGDRGWVFWTGISHGATCVGCCLALMALAFVLGMMNLAWMLVLTLVILVEKTAPFGERVSRYLGVALIVWGLTVAVQASYLH